MASDPMEHGHAPRRNPHCSGHRSTSGEILTLRQIPIADILFSTCDGHNVRFTLSFFIGPGSSGTVGKVECCSLPGLELYFHSGDHGPPHVHVLRPGEWEIRVDLLLTTEDHLDFLVKWPPGFTGPRKRLRARIRALVVSHRWALLEEWDRKVMRD
jgi:hypothetical protein